MYAVHVHTHTCTYVHVYTTLYYLLMCRCLCCRRVVQQLLRPHQRSKPPQHLILHQSRSVGILQGILVAWMEGRNSKLTTSDTNIKQYAAHNGAVQ